MDDKVILDKASFKALAVDSRVLILKTLNSRRHTQSELAADLDLAVPTVKEHLDALSKAGLVERQDDGHKWVYYALTKKGKAVVNPEEKKFWIVLSTLILSVVAAGSAYVKTQFGSLYAGTQFDHVSSKMAETAPTLAAAPEATSAADTLAATADAAGTMADSAAANAAMPAPLPWGWIILGVLVIAQLALLGYYWHKSRQHKKFLA